MPRPTREARFAGGIMRQTHHALRWKYALAGLTLCFAMLAPLSPANAGCVGPVIMGQCHGSEVPWDTHADPKDRLPDPGVFVRDKRGTDVQRKHPEWINPFTGEDAHDSHWHRNKEHR